MNIQLEPGEIVSITTAEGAIVINSDPETGATLVTVAHNEGYKLAPQVTQNEQTGEPNAQVWIQPAGL